MWNWLQKFKSCDGGNVAMMTAIGAVPVLMLVGMGVDSTRVSSAQSKLQHAVDAAALSAAQAYMIDGPQEMTAQGHSTFENNASNVTTFNITENSVRLTSSATVVYESTGTIKPMFPQLFGYPKLNFNVESEASLATPKGLEVAIAFDTTNSMDTGTVWQNALSVMESSLEDMKQFSGDGKFKVSLVPFGDRVNIGTSNQNWISGLVPSDWTGCVEPREEHLGTFEWSVDDDSAATEPFTATETDFKYDGASFDGGCPQVAITGPTDSPDEIIAAAKALSPKGTGRFDVGMAWAWRVLSPKWEGDWGVQNYPASNLNDYKKKIIFLSDGKTAAYNYVMDKQGGWGWNTGTETGFEHLVDLCARAKADGVEIYMVQIEGNPHAESYFKDCASSPSHYFHVQEGANVTVAFEDIVSELSTELRIIR